MSCDVWHTSEIRIDFEIQSWFDSSKHSKDEFIRSLLALPGVDEVKFGFTGFVRFTSVQTPQAVVECTRLVREAVRLYRESKEG